MKTTNKSRKFSALFILFIFVLSGYYNTNLKAGNFNNPAETDNTLSGTWILRTLNGNDVVKEKSGNEIPYLTLNTSENTVQGSTGCNSINGIIAVTGDEIKFSDMSMTKMFCSDADYEQDFVSALFQDGVIKYKLDNGNLIFYKKDVAIMSFEKK